MLAYQQHNQLMLCLLHAPMPVIIGIFDEKIARTIKIKKHQILIRSSTSAYNYHIHLILKKINCFTNLTSCFMPLQSTFVNQNMLCKPALYAFENILFSITIVAVIMPIFCGNFGRAFLCLISNRPSCSKSALSCAFANVFTPTTSILLAII